jgi:hypothetical protein
MLMTPPSPYTTLATCTPEFFRIPPDQVIELGARMEI